MLGQVASSNQSGSFMEFCMSRLGRLGALAMVLGVSSAALGCGPNAVRGEDVEGLDDQAMSTGLDRRDL